MRAHYFHGQASLPEDLLADVAALMFGAEAELAGWNGEGLPELDAQRLRFNGSRARHEDAQFLQVTVGHNDSECITAGLPYDAVVCAVLLRVAHYNPSFKIDSDRAWCDWAAGVDLYLRTFDQLPARPARISAH